MATSTILPTIRAILYISIGCGLGLFAVMSSRRREAESSAGLVGESTHFQVQSSASHNASSATTKLSQSRMFYEPVSTDVVFANIPAGFKRSDVEYTHGELIGWGPNRTYVRHFVDFGAPGTREFLFAPSKLPIAFLISLDHRLDRLNDTLDYFEGKLRILRVSAKHHVGFSNGDGISHIALMFAMERYGFPYVTVLEEDATPDVGWWLFYEIIALIRATRGNTGYVQLGPTSYGGVWWHSVLPEDLIYTFGNLATTGSILGRNMIPGAHRYLDLIATATSIKNHPIDIGLIHCGRVNVMIPMQLVVFQRRTLGGELYKTNFSTKLTSEHMSSFKRGVKPRDHYGFPTRYSLPLQRNRTFEYFETVGVSFESPFKFWRTSIGRYCLQGCPAQRESDTDRDWDWCSRGCPQ